MCVPATRSTSGSITTAIGAARGSPRFRSAFVNRLPAGSWTTASSASVGGSEIAIGAGVAAGAWADEGTVAGAAGAGAVSGAGTDDGGASTDIAIHAAARPAGTRKERQNAFVITCTCL